MAHLFFLNKYFFKYRRRFLLGILFIFISNFFQSLQPQMIREALDLVIENIAIYRMYDGFELQAEVFQHFGRTLLYFGIVVLVLALLMGGQVLLAVSGGRWPGRDRAWQRPGIAAGWPAASRARTS